MGIADRKRDGLHRIFHHVHGCWYLWVGLRSSAAVLLELTDDRRNVLGGNFSLVGIPSVGASGAIFGTLGVRRTTRT